MIFNTNVDDPIFQTVRVISFVKSKHSRPMIGSSSVEKEILFKQISYDSEVNCSVSDVRPAVNLIWNIRTTFGDKNVSMFTSVSNGGILQTSYAFTRKTFTYANLLALLVCKVDGPTVVINKQETQVLLLNTDFDCSSPILASKPIGINQRLNLNCGNERSENPFIVWMRLRKSVCECLLYASFLGNKLVQTYSDDYNVDDEGSLFLLNTELHHEGSYYCISGNGITNRVLAIDLQIYVNPVPPYPVIDGCNHPQYCVLEVQNGDVIRCSVFGIRPSVQLHFRVLHGGLEPSVTFSNRNVTVASNGNTFNIALTSEFHSNLQFQTRITIACDVSGPDKGPFKLSTNIDLLFINRQLNENTRSLLDVQVIFVVLIITAFVIVFVVLFVFGTILWRGERHDFIPVDWMNASRDLAILTDIGKRKYEKIESKYSLKHNKSNQQLAGEGDLCVVILGKTGVGKSATANSILGEKVFVEDRKTVPVTLKSTYGSREVNGRTISVIDTPGFFYSDATRDNIVKEVARIVTMCSNGVHAFIYVLNIASPRLTEKDLKFLKDVEEIFGGNLEKYRTLVFSHADSLDTDTSLDQFFAKQKEGTNRIIDFLHSFGSRIVAVDNKSQLPAEQKRNQDVIIALIDQVKFQSNSSVFSNKLFKTASQEKAKLLRKARPMQWDASILKSVEKIRASHPHLEASDSEFTSKVMHQLETERSRYASKCIGELSLLDKFKRTKGKRKDAYRHERHTINGDRENDTDGLENILSEIYQEYDLVLESIENMLDPQIV
ncbi:GTPase IMAP family member 4 [Holothuria leucospilota]|uniref:GTPase IMAP family member 4 n=1 Tax=Holothuria leucospilota TaxID=206669 RepID=A0A9Q0YC88_HOLLE|nr:GTPase IMAP family member 4 [Holothuria leucospilota]